jgi:DNA mismatch endonuclease (patch repair protein)
LLGKPDFVFPKSRLTVFVDGCFWHGCPKHGHTPRSNTAYWRKKIARNIERDQEVNRELKKRGWRVFRIWEHELTLKHRKRLLYRFRRIGLLS